MNIIVSILPLFLFLILLIVLDSFKLVKGKILGMCFTWGILSAIASYFINNYFIQVFNIPQSGVTWFEAPMVEESLKAVILVVLIRFNKIGFMIDGAIYGFATGAGFAFLENVFYLSQIEDHSLLVWIVRGFGTAIMHGGATSILCIIAINGINRKTRAPGSFALGLLVAIALHALYNQFIFSPQISTIIIVSTLPMIMFFVFRSNERYLRNWLEIELDTEIKLMVMIKKGRFSQTRAGEYLVSIKGRFQQEVVFDMLSFINLYLELSIRAKANLMLNESGFGVPKDPDLKNKLSELSALQKQIGATGMLAISPVLRMGRKDLWKLHQLK